MDNQVIYVPQLNEEQFKEAMEVLAQGKRYTSVIPFKAVPVSEMTDSERGYHILFHNTVNVNAT